MRRRQLRGGALAVVGALLLAGCTYSSREPGLFRQPEPVSPTSEAASSTLPEPTNRQLPVLGEQVWTTGEGLGIQIRFAVHAVRRMTGATVLDWSVTPLPSAGHAIGDPVPPIVDLGLRRDDNGDQRIYLIDAGGRVYRPLAARSRQVFQHCLCTPLWVAQLSLRVGETRMLQLVFPAMPTSVDHVDVSLPNTMPFWHVPVTPIGMVPLAMRSVDLTRPDHSDQPASAELAFTESDEPLGRQRSITLLAVQAASTETVLTWRLRSRDDEPFPAYAFGSPPVSATFGATAGLRTTDVASGPVLVVRGSDGRTIRLPARWLTTDQPTPGYLECLCSHFGTWALGLRTAGGTVDVATAYRSLPADTTEVSVLLPGLTTVPGVGVDEPAIDADRAVNGIGRVIVSTWTYDTSDPPDGWQTSDWPTPLPDPAQLKGYRARVDHLVDQPPAR